MAIERNNEYEKAVEQMFDNTVNEVFDLEPDLRTRLKVFDYVITSRHAHVFKEHKKDIYQSSVSWEYSNGMVTHIYTRVNTIMVIEHTFTCQLILQKLNH